MAIEIQLQSSQQVQVVPKQQVKQAQVPQDSNVASVVSEAQKLTVDGEKKAEEQSTNQLSDIQSKVAQLNDYVQNLDRNLQFTIDERTGSEVITVRDTETDEIIRQFPSEEVLKARSVVEQMKGLLLETKA